MPCKITCLVATALIISMIYFQNATTKSKVVQMYKDQLPGNLQERYNKISSERLRIYFYGYILGFILAFFIIIYNYSLKRNKLTTMNIVCIVIVVSFFTNYFYYILTSFPPKMLIVLNILGEIVMKYRSF